MNEAKELLAGCNFKRYAERILELSAFANKYLSDTTPWTVKKTDMDRYTVIMAGAASVSIALAALLTPIAPESARKLTLMLGISLENWPDTNQLSSLVASVSVTDPSPLFKKIEADPSDFNEKYK